MRWIWFFCGVSFLLISAFMDNARGPLFPALSSLLAFDYSTTGNLLVAGNLTAFALTMMLIPLSNLWSLRRMSIVAGTLVAALCMTAFFVDTIPRLYLWAGLLGGMLSVLGTLSNLFTQRSAPPLYRHRAMSGVHAAYGLASFIAPLVAAKILLIPTRWHWIYIGVTLPILALVFVCMRVAPTDSPNKGTDTKQAVHLKWEHWLVVGVMIFYVAGEVVTSMWMTTWAVSRGHTLQQGAEYTSLFFILMMITRLFCSFFVTTRWMWVVIWSSLILSALFFTLGRLLDLPWLVAGMGCLGPFFPLYMSYVTIRYPHRDRTIVIWILGLMQALLAVMNLCVGHLAVSFGIDLAYWLAPAMIAVSLMLLLILRRNRTVPIGVTAEHY